MNRKLLGTAALLILLALGYLAVRRWFDLDQVVAAEQWLRAAIKQHPWTSAWAGLAFYAITSLIPGTAGKSLVFGWLFGLWVGLVQVNVGLTLAAVGSFWISRRLFRELIESRYYTYIQHLNGILEREGAYVVLTLRLSHAPYTFVNYTLGATTLRTRTFWWTTQLGMLPGNLVFVYAGTQLPTLEKVVGHGLSTIFSPGVLIAFALLALFPWVVRGVLKRLSHGAVVGDPASAVANSRSRSRETLDRPAD